MAAPECLRTQSYERKRNHETPAIQSRNGNAPLEAGAQGYPHDLEMK